MRRPAVAVVLLAAVLAVTACDGQGMQPREFELSADAEDGRTVFTETSTPACVTCHATPEGGGQGRPLADLQLSDGEIAERIRAGGGGMPAYEATLDDAEIQALVAYLDEVAR